MPAIGIDSGSVAVKAVLMDEERLLKIVSEPTGADTAEQCRRLIETLRGFNGSQNVRVCATGYGRELVSDAHSTVSEIYANALGVGWAWRNWGAIRDSGPPAGSTTFYPDHIESPFRTIIDIGGQDSKVVTFDELGIVEGFAMNDRCAAGTGRFLQELADVLEVGSLESVDRLAATGKEHGVNISSTCTVFAESEVVSLLSGGVPKPAIASGIFNAIASRVFELAETLNWTSPVLFDGGTARLRSLRLALCCSFGVEVAVPAYPQFITAIGAALHSYL